MDRNERLDAEIKKTIDGRTKEFKEKLQKLAYEKVKQILSPEAEPLKGKGYPYQEKVQESIEEESDSELYQSYIEDVNEEVFTFSLDESVITERLRVKKPNELATIDIDYIGNSSDRSQSERKHRIKIKMTGRQTADVTGKKGDIVKFLQGDAYAMDDEDIEDIFPELLEGVKDVENMFGFRAADWRKLVKKHARHIDAFQKGRKDLPKNVEDELLAWAMDNGEVRNDDDAEDFIDIVLNASFTPTRNDIIAEENLLKELKARYDLSDMRSSKDPKVKREFKKLEKVQYGSLQYIRQYKEVEKALDDSLPAHQRKK